MKAVILVDMPDDVSLDEWYAVKVIVDRLKIKEEDLMQGIPFDESKTFKFVPLRPLPQKIYAEFPDPYEYGLADGYNRCIDEVMGETKDATLD